MTIKQAAIWKDEFLEKTTAVIEIKNLIEEKKGNEEKREQKELY
jgi:hypothetical protein